MADASNLTPNPFPSGKGNRIYVSENKRASSPFCDFFSLGAEVTLPKEA